MKPVRTRFAPSPTGDLHVGGAWTALASWALARAAGGETILRMEDIDTPRVVSGSAARIVDDLGWLGLDFDVSYTQSERTSIYEAALARLDAAGLTYLCDCSRAEIARVASAPHAGEEITYPRTCRDAPRDREFKRPPAIRLRVPDEAIVEFEDGVQGPIRENVAESASDFVLRRADGIFAYQLVVAIDDAGMGISHVVRGADLLGSTARQILLMRLLGYGDEQIPSYVHVPLVVSGGERLAKRIRSVTIRSLGDRGVSAEEILGELAHGLGLVGGGRQAMPARAIAAVSTPPSAWTKTAWSVPDAWAAT